MNASSPDTSNATKERTLPHIHARNEGYSWVPPGLPADKVTDPISSNLNSSQTNKKVDSSTIFSSIPSSIYHLVITLNVLYDFSSFFFFLLFFSPSSSSPQIDRYFRELSNDKVPKTGSLGEKYRDKQLILQLPKQDLALPYCKFLEKEHHKAFEDFVNTRNECALDIGFVCESLSSSLVSNHNIYIYIYMATVCVVLSVRGEGSYRRNLLI